MSWHLKVISWSSVLTCSIAMSRMPFLLSKTFTKEIQTFMQLTAIICKILKSTSVKILTTVRIQSVMEDLFYRNQTLKACPTTHMTEKMYGTTVSRSGAIWKAGTPTSSLTSTTWQLLPMKCLSATSESWAHASNEVSLSLRQLLHYKRTNRRWSKFPMSVLCTK